MKKVIVFVCLLLLFVAAVFILQLSAEKAQLRDSIIRLHVIANSDSEEDQAQKLRVRDAVLAYLMPLLNDVSTTAEAEKQITDNVIEIERIVADFLKDEGTNIKVRVTVAEECFDTRYYDTFALPAGVYKSLQIQLGNAEGQNWWCVAFPSLCIPSAGKSFNDVAAGAGFSDGLTNSLAGGNKLEVRFFVLDLLGRIENFFFK